MEGDISGFFDNIDHHILTNILRERIIDENFIGLIWKFLKAGYLEDWQFHNTISGAPQGSICSPILSNIYLDKLDKYIEKYQTTFNIGQKKDRIRNQEYRKYELQLTRLNRKLKDTWKYLTDEEKQVSLERKQEIQKIKLQIPYYISKDINYKRIKYVRYADDFLIGIHGSKDDAIKVKKDIKLFLESRLKLQLSEEKTLITHSDDMARFLGYDIVVRRDNHVSRDKNGFKKRMFNYNVGLYIPHELWCDKLLNLGVLKITKQSDGKEIWKPFHRPVLTHLDDLEILSKYNAEIRGYHNYYRFADNSTVLQKFRYIMEYSMYKTYANKYQSSIGKMKKKFCIDGKFAIKYKTKNGMNISFFYNESFAKCDILKWQDLIIDDKSVHAPYVFGRTKLIDRLKSKECEMCGKRDIPLEMHHVKKLKNLKGKQAWEILMIAKKRKTLAVCKECHNLITLQQRMDSKKR